MKETKYIASVSDKKTLVKSINHAFYRGVIGPIQKRWLLNVLSGKYRQGQDYLKSMGDDGIHRFCCLGVFAESEGYANQESCQISDFDDIKYAFDDFGEFSLEGNYEDLGLYDEEGRLFNGEGLTFNNFELFEKGRPLLFRGIAGINDWCSSFLPVVSAIIQFPHLFFKEAK